jgi:hypothetical protein
MNTAPVTESTTNTGGPCADVRWGYHGELAADLICLRRAELGVQGECELPVVAGLLVLEGAVVAFGEVAVRAGLLVGVAGLGGRPERCAEFGTSGGGLPGSVQALGEAAQRQGLAVLVTGLPVQGACRR